MDPQDIINLFDSYWFNLDILNKNPITSTSSNFEATPYQEIHKNHLKDADHPIISKLPSIIMRSKSDQISSTSSLFPDSTSPNSVLQTIVSDKQITTQEKFKQIEEPKAVNTQRKRGKSGRKKMHSSKSLSKLEFEELKGFMDLGFVFTEEDKNSKLVEIIPGLQRLGQKEEEISVENLDESSSSSSCSVARPYLSEAWEVLDRRDKEIPVMNWNIPDLNNDADVKNSLRLWAHNVAATLIRC